MSNFPVQLGELLEVEIERLSFGGSGIARYTPQGSDAAIVIFVPLSAPGDRLQIKISQIKKRHAEAEIEKILHPGPDRVKPPCVVFGQCGGCNWQHLSYESQLRIKQDLVSDFLKKFVSTGTESETMAPIVPSPQPLHYRNRSQLKFKNKNLGFFKKNSHDIVDIEECWILEESLSQKIPALKQELRQKNLPPHVLEKVELSLQKFPAELESEESEDSGQGFSQVNRFQNENLITAVLAALKNASTGLGATTTIFDLYAGSGNFTFPLLKAAEKRRVIGVELHAGAAKIAQDRLKQMNVSPKAAEFYSSDVAVFLRRFPIGPEDFVLLDPPRIGCSEEVISALAAAAPRRILYISCDPAALARDLDRLWIKSVQKYQIQQVQCFDMFPQTHHVETLVEIVRKPLN